MSTMEYFNAAVGIAAGAASYYQGHQLHSLETDLAKRQHLMETFSDLERHFIELDSDLVSAVKESERDMYDQRNQQLQTLVLSCTVMFAALSTIIVQSTLPEKSSEIVQIAFAACNGLSFACLLLCLGLCVEILTLSSRFMLVKAGHSAKNVDNARNNTITLFNKIRQKNFNWADGELRDEFRGVADSKVEPAERVAELWVTSEKGATAMLQERRELISSLLSPTSFERFWNECCGEEKDAAVSLFYLGTGFMLISIVIYLVSQYVLVYDCPIGAGVGSFFICASLATSIGITIYMKLKRPELYFMAIGDVVEVKSKVSTWMCCFKFHSATIETIHEDEFSPAYIDVRYAKSNKLEKFVAVDRIFYPKATKKFETNRFTV